jgi:hypothetical protein
MIIRFFKQFVSQIGKTYFVIFDFKTVCHGDSPKWFSNSPKWLCDKTTFRFINYDKA